MGKWDRAPVDRPADIGSLRRGSARAAIGRRVVAAAQLPPTGARFSMLPADDAALAGLDNSVNTALCRRWQPVAGYQDYRSPTGRVRKTEIWRGVICWISRREASGPVPGAAARARPAAPAPWAGRAPAAAMPSRPALPGPRRPPALRRGNRRRLLAVRQPDVIDRVIDGVEAGARGEHPSGENAFHLAGERDLVDLDESVGLRRFGRRPREADARRHLQRAELNRLVDIDVEGDDASGDLVEPGKHRDRVGDLFGAGGRGQSASASAPATAVLVTAISERLRPDGPRE